MLPAGTPETGEAGEERTFPATVEKVPEIVAYVSGRAGEHGFADLRLKQLELAVEEAAESGAGAGLSGAGTPRPAGSC